MVLLLSKAQALHYTGQGSRVDAVFAEAEALAASSEDPGLKLRAREARAAYYAAKSLTPENVGLLRQLEQEYMELGDRRSAGRLTSELSVLFTNTKRFAESLAASQRGLKVFEELGDDYGISISLRNMATSMAEIHGREKEAVALIEKLQGEQAKTATQRERAWLCNYMVRTLRRKKQFPEALRYGQEAVHIGEELGDLTIAGTNRINVGNVYRDMGELDAALTEYSAGGDLAHRYGDKSLESTACRLAAGIYRRQGNNRVALEHAQLSVSLRVRLLPPNSPTLLKR
jgi:tetratricopeptide (TPR) repeat protein